jgi:hypothetical protein
MCADSSQTVKAFFQFIRPLFVICWVKKFYFWLLPGKGNPDINFFSEILRIFLNFLFWKKFKKIENGKDTCEGKGKGWK